MKPNARAMRMYTAYVEGRQRGILRALVPIWADALDGATMSRTLDASQGIIFAALAQSRAVIAQDFDVDLRKLGIVGSLLEADARNQVRRAALKAVLRASAQKTPEGQAAILKVQGFTSEPQQKLIDSWVQDNVALITDADADMLQKMRDVVREGALEGWGNERLARAIHERARVGMERARLISVDQCGKLNGQIARAGFEAAEMDSYRWVAQHGTRTRPTHQKLDGTIHKWSEEPPISEANGDRNHPGQAIRCRCFPEPVFIPPRKRRARAV